ncbi:MAG: hypothetical protein PHE70_00595 [Tepidanaerobacteraceae bacterium]|nr:hypothetical protein [Tepidanaerobacteraceae bacterium]
MKFLAFIIIIGIASVVFYLFLRNLFEDRLAEPLIPKDKDIEEPDKSTVEVTKEDTTQSGEVQQ